MNLPPMIVFINADINSIEQNTLQTQLYIDQTITKQEFDARIIADPNYPAIIHLTNLRVMVIVPDYHDQTNRELADVVLFLHQGQADVERNKFCAPGQSFPIERLTMYEILRAAHSSNVVLLPFEAFPRCDSCKYPFYCDQCHTFSGIKICGTCKHDCKCFCNVHAPNCDNIYHNHDFLHRK